MNKEPKTKKGTVVIFAVTMIGMFFFGGSPSETQPLASIIAFFAVVVIGSVLCVWNEDRRKRDG